MTPGAAVRTVTNRTPTGRPSPDRGLLGAHTLKLPMRRRWRLMSASWHSRVLTLPAMKASSASSRFPAVKSPITGELKSRLTRTAGSCPKRNYSYVCWMAALQRFAVSHVLEVTARKQPLNVEAQRAPNSSLERPAGQQIQLAGNVPSGLPSSTSSVPVAPSQQPWPRTPKGCFWRPGPTGS